MTLRQAGVAAAGVGIGIMDVHTRIGSGGPSYAGLPLFDRLFSGGETGGSSGCGPARVANVTLHVVLGEAVA